MELDRQDFVNTKEISVDLNYAQPRIRLVDERKCLIKEIHCNNKEDADILFNQVVSVWSEVKREEGKIGTS